MIEQNKTNGKCYDGFSNESLETALDPNYLFGLDWNTIYIAVPITVIYAAVFFTGSLGNILTCVVIVKHKSMHTATNYYLFNLAISDLLLLISGLPQEMYLIWKKCPNVFGSTFCLIRGLVAETSTNASVLTIVLLTIERYLAICHPFRSHTMSKLSRATNHIVLLWVVAFALALPQALQFGLRTHNRVVVCLQARIIVEHSFMISTFLLFILPMALMMVLYLLIAVKLMETSSEDIRKCRKGTASFVDETKKCKKFSRRVIKMLVAVGLAFFICWAPFHAQRLVAIYGTTEDHFLHNVITNLSGVSYYMSTCINPILYHIMDTKFREAFWALTCRYGMCNASSMSQGSHHRQLRVSRERLTQSLVAMHIVPKDLQITTGLNPNQDSLKSRTPDSMQLLEVVTVSPRSQQLMLKPFPFILQKETLI